MRNSLIMVCVLLGACEYNNGNPSKSPTKEPREPKLMEQSKPLELTPQDDIEIVVKPGWHSPPEYVYDNHLRRVNPTEKGKLNTNQQ